MSSGFPYFLQFKSEFVNKDFMKKDINGMDLTEAEDIKKRWQEYIEEWSKNILMTQITMMV